MSSVEAPPEPRIGPSFAAELVAADLADWRFSWASDGGLLFHPEMSEDERAKVHAVLAAHRPPSAEDLAALERIARLKTLALGALLDALLEAETLTPNPPQAIVDWRDARQG